MPNHISPALPAGGQTAPEFGRIPAAVAHFGISRSGLYRLAADGRVRMVKLGSATLLDFESVRAYLAALPAAEIASRAA